MADVETLQTALEAEQQRTKQLEYAISELKKKMGQMEVSMEAEGERIAITLTRKLEKLRAEKARLQQDVEREEEYISTRLQTRLEEVLKEKADMEEHVEIEHERLVNALQRKLAQAQRESALLRRRVSASSSGQADTSPERATSSPSKSPSRLPDLLLESDGDEFTNMKKQLEHCLNECRHSRHECADLQRANQVLREEIRRLRESKFVLQQKLRAVQEELEAAKSPVRHSDEGKHRARANTTLGLGKRGPMYRSYSFGSRARVRSSDPKPSPEAQPDMVLPHEKVSQEDVQ